MGISSFKNKLFTRNFILLLIAIIFVIVAVVLFLALKAKKDKIIPPSTFTSNDSAISLSVPGELNFSDNKDDSYVLSLTSPYGFSIYISQTFNTNVRDTLKFIEADKNDYISKFSSINQVSDVTESTIQDLTSYNYHFYYKDTNYIDVYWILKDSTFYVIDFTVNTTNEDLSSHISEILGSLKFN